MFRSATFKLTLWYLAIVMAISLLFSVVLYHVATVELARGLGRETARIYSRFPVFQGNSLLKPGRDYDDSAHHLLLQLIGLNAFVLVSAGVASYGLARRTLRPIEEAHEQQKRFTADVSHELRTPLTALKMESEVALMNPKTNSSELRDIIKSNLEEAAKLDSIINSLLRLTRLEEAELRHSFIKLSSTELASSAIASVEAQAHDRNITVASKVSSHNLEGDQESMLQLLVILLDNAIKYSKDGSEVSLKGKLEGKHFVFVVQDNGIGIDPIALQHIFDRFYRADSSRTGGTAGAEGFGLGLSIAKMIADIHQTEIIVSSKVNHGTTVKVRVPLVQKM